MKVAIVTPYSWTVPGGVNAHIAGLAGYMRSQGHEVRILAPADGEVDAGVIALGRTIGIPYNGSVARVAVGPRLAARVRVALRRARPDLVHVHEPFVPSASMVATLATRAPVVATFHASIDARLYRAARIPLSPLWRRITARIAVSEAARSTVESMFGPGCRVISNGVDTDAFAGVSAARASEPTVVYFGRLERRKGPQVLVEALPRVARAIPNVRVTIAGDGPERARLQEGLDASVRDSVSFPGRFSDAERLALLEESMVACFPALGGESFGIAVVEAMAAGRPIVASAIPGFAAVVRDGVDGVLVPPGDAGALAAALVRLLSAPEEAAVMGLRARERARVFDWATVGAEVEGVYSEAMASGRRRRGLRGRGL
ncbi:MAG: glycosyltransferase family 4 protein [Actinomycetota bacterium]